MAAFGLSFFFTTTASAACYIDGASGRLVNYCALDKIQGATVDVRTAQIIDYKLKREGSTRGLGFTSRIKPHSVSKYLFPTLSYSSKINGGNSPEPLVLGNLTFEGDEQLYRKEGVVAGFGTGISGRYIHAQGKYFTYGVNTIYAFSPKYKLGITTASANASSINHIKNWWFLDAHISKSRVRKDITDDKNSNLSVVTAKVYSSGDNTFSEASVGVNRYFAESYTQN